MRLKVCLFHMLYVEFHVSDFPFQICFIVYKAEILAVLTPRIIKDI